jgi:hypothetical protein
MSSLAKSIDRLAKTDGVSGGDSDALGGLSIEFLFKIALKIGSIDIELFELAILMCY